MKKRFIINILIVGSVCLLIFGILQQTEVRKFREKNMELESQKQHLEKENKQLRENLQRINASDSTDMDLSR